MTLLYPRIEGNLLVIDNKWAVKFDPANNDRPENWVRYDSPSLVWDGSNPDLAMFYCLLEVARRNSDDQ